MMWEKTPAREANIARQKVILNDHFSGRRVRVLKTSKVTSAQKEGIKRRRYAGEDPMDLALEFGISAGYIRSLAQWIDEPHGA